MGDNHLVAPTGEWGPHVRAELEATDWSKTPVVDVVTFLPATSRGLEGDQRRVEVYRHVEGPPLSLYENAERRVRVERLTRPLFERLTADAESSPRQR
ncbi:hypothetical protein [Halorarius halobius]|uniref:hypothetical protein n=1 Tax=Halorarius halobius TaxID=2962671 RepID=UPI0020CDAFE3|nr:hypothetical protein [Halorarius halobius]